MDALKRYGFKAPSKPNNLTDKQDATCQLLAYRLYQNLLGKVNDGMNWADALSLEGRAEDDIMYRVISLLAAALAQHPEIHKAAKAEQDKLTAEFEKMYGAQIQNNPHTPRC